jgi:membrane associated rhomboid family serine protease
MGLYDRDYYRERNGFAAFDSRVRACYVLAGIYACLLLIQQAATEPASHLRRPVVNPVANLLELKPSAFLDGDLWRITTYSFVQETAYPWALVINVVFLIWFGRHIEEMYGWKEFLAFYLLAGMAAGLGYVLIAAVAQLDGALLGPAALITAVMVLYALHRPRRTVMLFFVLPCPVWLVVALYVLLDGLAPLAGRPHWEAFAGHAAAAAFAFVYHRYESRFTRRLRVGTYRSPAHPRPVLQIFQIDPAEAETAAAPTGLPAVASRANAHGSPSAANASTTMDEHLEAKLDEVLEKVKKHGQQSLTDEERAVLFRASAIYRKRRQRGEN